MRVQVALYQKVGHQSSLVACEKLRVNSLLIIFYKEKATLGLLSIQTGRFQ